MKYVVYLKGDDVWGGVSIQGFIDNVEGRTLEKVADYIESKYYIHVHGFTKTWGFFKADTSSKGVLVIIEKAPCL